MKIRFKLRLGCVLVIFITHLTTVHNKRCFKCDNKACDKREKCPDESVPDWMRKIDYSECGDYDFSGRCEFQTTEDDKDTIIARKCSKIEGVITDQCEDSVCITTCEDEACNIDKGTCSVMNRPLKSTCATTCEGAACNTDKEFNRYCFSCSGQTGPNKCPDESQPKWLKSLGFEKCTSKNANCTIKRSLSANTAILRRCEQPGDVKDGCDGDICTQHRRFGNLCNDYMYFRECNVDQENNCHVHSPSCNNRCFTKQNGYYDCSCGRGCKISETECKEVPDMRAGNEIPEPTNTTEPAKTTEPNNDKKDDNDGSNGSSRIGLDSSVAFFCLMALVNCFVLNMGIKI